MANLKPKEPLIAVMLSVILSGLGQIYVGRIKRGIVLFCIPLIVVIPGFLYMVNPATKISNSLAGYAIILAIVGFAYSIYVIVDAYICAKNFNVKNNLTRNISIGKRILLILGILFFLFVISPSQLIGSYVKSNVIEAYKIPSGTMMPTLMIGDRIFVNKTIYKQSEPKRGDVAVFIAPDKFDKNYIKRVVGLPGETIEIKDGKALINGVVITEPAVFRKNHYYNAGEYAKAGQPVKIPEDSYFVLGDNSSSSKDSRYFGFVPRKSFIGKAFKIYYPFDRSGPIN